MKRQNKITRKRQEGVKEENPGKPFTKVFKGGQLAEVEGRSG